MKNIKEFKSIEEFNKYANKVRKIYMNTIGEGPIYITKDNEVLKDVSNIPYPMYLSKKQDIIMDSDYNLDSFMFPTELYIYKDMIIGYTSKYFRGDIFEEFFGDINIDALIRAREKMIEDIKVLTNDGYYLYDLAFNTLFNNKKLCAIDTLDYYRKENVTLKENLDILDYGLVSRLRDHGLCRKNIKDGEEFEKVITKIKKKSR